MKNTKHKLDSSSKKNSNLINSRKLIFWKTLCVFSCVFVLFIFSSVQVSFSTTLTRNKNYQSDHTWSSPMDIIIIISNIKFQILWSIFHSGGLTSPIVVFNHIMPILSQSCITIFLLQLFHNIPIVVLQCRVKPQAGGIPKVERPRMRGDQTLPCILGPFPTNGFDG
jgi:hypothetical protein